MTLMNDASLTSHVYLYILYILQEYLLVLQYILQYAGYLGEYNI